jgi:hypothetical protein
MIVKFAALFVGAILVVSGCSGPALEETELEPEPTTPVLELEVGTCVNDANTPLSADIADVPQVPCAEPHDSELYAVIPVTEGSYPGADQLISQGRDACQEEFSGFVGIDFRSSQLDFYFYYPTPSSWSVGDRVIYCMVFDPGLSVVGSLRGANR